MPQPSRPRIPFASDDAEQHRPMHGKELEQQLLKAHEGPCPDRLAKLYAQAADNAVKHDDIDAACFYLTQALVYALEAGLDESEQLRETLRGYGRL